MSTVLEYSYDYDDVPPLDDKEAVEKYKQEKTQNPDALVVLDRLNCGVHWQVKVYRTQAEKETYLAKRVSRVWELFANKFSHK